MPSTSRLVRQSCAVGEAGQAACLGDGGEVGAMSTVAVVVT